MHRGYCASGGEEQECWGLVGEEAWELVGEVQADTVT